MKKIIYFLPLVILFGLLSGSTLFLHTVAGAEIRFDNPIGNDTITGLVASVLKWMKYVVTPIAVIMIIYAGFLLLASRGDPARIKTGKAVLTWAVVGLAVIYIGAGFISLIRSIIGLAK